MNTMKSKNIILNQVVPVKLLVTFLPLLLLISCGSQQKTNSNKNIIEISDSSGNNQHKLVHTSIQSKNTENSPPNNLVFLLDISDAMNSPNKLPLIKSAFQSLVNELTEKDTVSIVVYSGAKGVVLPPTKGNEKNKIIVAINNLEAGGSTAEGEGIELAYYLAKKFYKSSGNNRVILATDGNFNLGISKDAELVKTIENYRDEGIFLSILGFSTGNFKDAKMEKLADKGNGNYAYIDNLLAAQKALETETGKTIINVAEDNKIQSEAEVDKASIKPPNSTRNAPVSRRENVGGGTRGSASESFNLTPGFMVQKQSLPASTAESQIDSSLEPTSNTEEYNLINDNPFQVVKNNPLSTFSIDVDTASYSNLRRFISEGKLPPKDAVRIEELINYFTYNYPQPKANNPFSVTTEISDSPWNSQHKLVHIGVQGKEIVTEDLPPSNLVFLLDVSGSMNDPNKLPLIKSAFQLLVDELTEKDTVSIVVYAGAAGVVLPPTKGNEKDKILAAINNLEAGGSTAGGEGIKLAYDLAKRFYKSSGNNRVILATDGDFNVGVSSDAELVRMIENYRDEGIFLTVLGFGTGNFKDAKMEQLANKGNGNYAYIDNLLEAKKVLVTEMGGTLLTIAKDVKIQVEFNPAKVQAYRLIGYENRLLRSQDFNDDKKDAGELGAGHSVTALYEIIPVGVKSNVKLPDVDELKYQDNKVDEAAYNSDELMLVKLRYKEPKGTTSQLIKQPIIDKGVSLDDASNDFKFAAAVAEYGMILRDSEYKSEANFNQVLKLANESKSLDLEGYRSEFINMVESSQKLKEKK
ncbi:von Willebrand factor type A domain-containing protein [Okeania sp.]|uniref:vWA domain-containing protein n=1 Tax=Okeania sp. TaxID=3100323 RepID=UPI002B4AE8B6|nr:von Willebrand factor type A domain-containing protein [Okeania sp.]MEB3342118.1 von Willebrand factor type A domain-containing protein [Okeania sp.]